MASFPGLAGHPPSVFSLVHFFSVQLISHGGRGHWQEMRHGGVYRGRQGLLRLDSCYGQQGCVRDIIGHDSSPPGSRRRTEEGMRGWDEATPPRPSHQLPPLSSLMTTSSWSLGLLCNAAAARPQMLTSLTSVGVQDRSASSSTCLVSVVPWCCWAWRRLDSSRDSICSWHDRKQSCVWTCQHRVKTMAVLTTNMTHQTIWLWKSTCALSYRVTANDLRQEVGEVLGGQGGILALQVKTLNSSHHTACCHHGWWTSNEVYIY